MVDKDDKYRGRINFTGITIENFKGIKGPVHIPLGPMTLLFGANSAGKSTVGHALQYFHHVLETADPDVHQTTIGGSSVDLGGFQNIVYKHELDRSIRITLHRFDRLHTESYLDDTGSEKRVPDGNTTRYWPYEDCDFGARLGEAEFAVRITCSWDSKLSKPWVERYEVFIDREPIAAVVQGPSPSDKASNPTPTVYISDIHPLLVDMNDLDKDDPMRDVHEYIQDIFGGDVSLDSESADAQPPWMRFDIEGEPLDLSIFDDLGDSGEASGEASGEPQLVPRQKGTFRAWQLSSVIWPWGDVEFAEFARTSDEDDPIRKVEGELFYSAVAQLVAGPGHAILKALRGTRYIGPLRDVPRKEFRSAGDTPCADWSAGGAAWDLLHYEDDVAFPQESLLLKINQALRVSLGTQYRLVKRKRLLVDSEGNIIQALRLLRKAYEERDGDYLAKVVLEPLLTQPYMSQLMLVDDETDTEVNISDVGVGISQLVPVLVGALAPGATLLAVEQPELHVHPALQSKMGDVFLDAVGSIPNVLIETHSEHLILRVLRRIREVSESGESHWVPAKPRNIQVVYLRSEDEQTRAYPLEITEDGDFATDWPDGFFTEREEDLF